MARSLSVFLLLLALMTTFAGCGSGGGESLVAPVEDPARLRSAPEQLSLGAKTLRLAAYLWRDFQPISPPDGRPLIGTLNIRTADSTAFPQGLVPEAVWILNGENLWAVPVTELRIDAQSPTAIITVRNGPKWGPNIPVDVVVRLRDAANTTYLLQIKQQTIHRTN